MTQHRKEDPLWSFKDDGCRLKALQTQCRHETARKLGWPVIVALCTIAVTLVAASYPGSQDFALKAYMGAMHRLGR